MSRNQQVALTCQKCQKPFRVSPSEVKRRVCCSRKCIDEMKISEEPRQLRRKRITKAWADKNKERLKAIAIKYRYGLTAERHKAMLAEQDGLCAICKCNPATDIDHSHDRNFVRGLLCGHCNRGIGLFRDNLETVIAAAAYLQKWEHVEAQPTVTRRAYNRYRPTSHFGPITK